VIKGACFAQAALALWGKSRRTQIIAGEGEIDLAGLIPREDWIISISHTGLRPAAPLAPRPTASKRGCVRGMAAQANGRRNWIEAPAGRLDPTTTSCSFTTVGKV